MVRARFHFVYRRAQIRCTQKISLINFRSVFGWVLFAFEASPHRRTARTWLPIAIKFIWCFQIVHRTQGARLSPRHRRRRLSIVADSPSERLCGTDRENKRFMRLINTGAAAWTAKFVLINVSICPRAIPTIHILRCPFSFTIISFIIIVDAYPKWTKTKYERTVVSIISE